MGEISRSHLGEQPCCEFCAVPSRSPCRIKRLQVSASRKATGWHAAAIPLMLSYSGKEGHLARGQSPLGQPVSSDWSMWGQTVGSPALTQDTSMGPSSSGVCGVDEPFICLHLLSSPHTCLSPINPLNLNPLPKSASHRTQRPWARSGNWMPAGLPWPPFAYQNLFQYFPLPLAFTLTEWLNL